MLFYVIIFYLYSSFVLNQTEYVIYYFFFMEMGFLCTVA